MRVLFLTLYPPIAASPRYRVHQFLPALAARGIQCTVAAAVSEETWLRHHAPDAPRARAYHLEEIRRQVTQILGARKYDLVVVQKGLTTPSFRGLAALLRRTARRLVLDVDDAVHRAPPVALRGAARLLADQAQLIKVAAAADCVLAGNDWLAAQLQPHAQRVEVVPTVVDTDRFVPAAAPPDTYTLGWMGSPSTTPHLQIAAAALQGAPDVPAVILCGADPRQRDWPAATLAPWRLETEVTTLHRFSAGLMPLPDEPWTHGKCGLKALQYGACALPTVASPVGVAGSIVQDGETGILAQTPEAWRTAIARLRDPAERVRMGAAARARVEEAYSLRDWAPRLADLLESVA